MSVLRHLSRIVATFVVSLATFGAVAADYPTAKQGTFVAKDFRFATGEVMPELKLQLWTMLTPPPPIWLLGVITPDADGVKISGPFSPTR